MQKPLSLLLTLTAIFTLHFWLMIVNHYSLRGKLLGLPTTAVVGSSAIVLLAFLIVKVRQPTPRLPVESPSPWNTRLELVFSIMGFLLAGLLLPVNEEAIIVLLLLAVLALCLWIYIGLILLVSSVLLNIRLLISGSQIDSATEKVELTQITLVIGTLIGIILICIAIIGFFNMVVFRVNEAALSHRLELVVYTLQAIGLVLVLAFFLGKLQYTMPGDQLLCSKSYLSPSGQRSIVIEDYEEWEGDRYYSYAYLNGLIFRKDLGDFPNRYDRYGFNRYCCTQGKLTLNWSDDERQVDWEKLRP